MLGEKLQVANNLWYIQGEMPEDSSKDPDPCNVVVYKAGERLYLVDSSSGSMMRDSIANLLASIGKVDSFTLINTHSHLDHICNNDLIDKVDARTKHHYILRSGMSAQRLDAPTYFAEQFDAMDETYDPFGGYQAYRAKYAFAGALRDVLGFFMGRRRVLKFLFSGLFKKFGPVGDSRATMEALEDMPAEEARLGKLNWKSWKLGPSDVLVLEGRGHTDDEVFVYIPEHRMLCLGDLTFPLFPTWANSHASRIIDCLEKALAMTRSGLVDILADGHGDRLLRSRKDIEESLEKTIADHRRLEEILRDILRNEDGLTPGEIYERFKRRADDHVTKRYLELEFPRTPASLQNVMVTTLLQMGYEARGRRRHKRFFQNTRSPQSADFGQTA